MTKDYSKYFTPSLNQARKRRGEKVEIIRFKLGEKYRGVGPGKYHLKPTAAKGILRTANGLPEFWKRWVLKETLSEMEADLILFNTCAIREMRKIGVWGIGPDSKNQKRKPDLVIGVCGHASGRNDGQFLKETFSQYRFDFRNPQYNRFAGLYL